jgi:hypothetical protein
MGGNSISPKGETGTIHQQFSHIRETVEGIPQIVSPEYVLKNSGKSTMLDLESKPRAIENRNSKNDINLFLSTSFLY